MLLCRCRKKRKKSPRPALFWFIVAHPPNLCWSSSVSPEQVPRVSGLFCPPPERLSLRRLWGPPLQTTRRFLPPDVENLRELRSERKGEKWIRAGVHALASFARAGGSWTHGGARLEWRLGGGGALENEMVHDPGEWGVPLAHGLASGFAELLLLPLCWLALNNNTNTNLLQHVSL